MSPLIFNELFRRRDINYNLQSNSNFAVPSMSWEQKYFLPRSKHLRYCTFADERVALSECLQKLY